MKFEEQRVEDGVTEYVAWISGDEELDHSKLSQIADSCENYFTGEMGNDWFLWAVEHYERPYVFSGVLVALQKLDRVAWHVTLEPGSWENAAAFKLMLDDEGNFKFDSP